MPNMVPETVETVLRLRDEPRERLQAISFFLLGLAFSAAAVYGLWNYLARDFKRLPRIGYLQSLVLVILWGLLSVIVLTMISGARELMTPGAWRQQGLTYTLEQTAPAISNEESAAEGRPRTAVGPLAEEMP